jgi:1-deoxy-D-xylulose-5-phosphate reductoisomerase
MPTILNAANEIAVETYMAGKIGFYAISEIVEAVCSTFSGGGRVPATIAEALAIDGEARDIARRFIPAKQV